MQGRRLAWALAARVVLTALIAGCDTATPQNGSPQNVAAAAASSQAAAPLRPEGKQPISARTETATRERCVVPRVEPAPPVAAPAAQCPADPETVAALPKGRVRFLDAPSAPVVSVERALTDAARTRGLMYRTQLGADQGMLFSWNAAEPRSFWMRNTCIPLDMLFIADDGTIVGILEQVPTLNTLPRGVPCPARHVLELNAGWARQHGVLPGQRVDLET